MDEPRDGEPEDGPDESVEPAARRLGEPAGWRLDDVEVAGYRPRGRHRLHPEEKMSDRDPIGEAEPRPEILDEAAIADDEAALDRPALDLMQIPRLIGGALADIRTIAEGMAVLPKLLLSLDTINEKVESLDAEVRRMRAAVESMGGDVDELGQTMSRVEPHLEDVSRVAHPLRRISTARTRRQSTGR